jgi:hypothetical protein
VKQLKVGWSIALFAKKELRPTDKVKEASSKSVSFTGRFQAYLTELVHKLKVSRGDRVELLIYPGLPVPAALKCRDMGDAPAEVGFGDLASSWSIHLP